MFSKAVSQFRVCILGSTVPIRLKFKNTPTAHYFSPIYSVHCTLCSSNFNDNTLPSTGTMTINASTQTTSNVHFFKVVLFFYLLHHPTPYMP